MGKNALPAGVAPSEDDSVVVAQSNHQLKLHFGFDYCRMVVDQLKNRVRESVVSELPGDLYRCYDDDFDDDAVIIEDPFDQLGKC